MLDERWSQDAEEIGSALRRMLSEESSIARVRAAEATPDGRDRALEDQLEAFGVSQLPAEPDILARVAYEIGRAIAPCTVVERLPAQQVLGEKQVSYGFEGDVPASVGRTAVAHASGVVLVSITGPGRRTAAGDFLTRPDPGVKGVVAGDSANANRMRRLMWLADSARLIGAGQALLDIGVAYSKERVAGGRVIGSYQAVAHKLVNVAIELEGAELLLRKTAFTAQADAGGDGAPPGIFAALLRAKAVRAARLAATTVHQVMGGNGFTVDYDCQLYSRRIRNWTGRLAPPGPALADVARQLLDPRQRDDTRWLWQYEKGLSIPDWAKQSDRETGSSKRAAVTQSA